MNVSKGPTAASDNSGVGSVAWQNPSFAQDEGANDATASAITTANLTHYLWCTGFGFAIPAGSTITGIGARVRKAASNTRGRDAVVQLLQGGALAGNNLADTVTAWPTPSIGDVSYGGDGNLWGASWTVDQVNAADFGIAIQGNGNHASQSVNLSIDYVELTVYYTLAGTDYPETINNGVGIVDARAPVVGVNRILADALGITDVAAGLANLVRSVSEAMGIADVASEDLGAEAVWNVNVTIG